MSKRLFIVHGWDGSPNDGWFPWLKQECETRGFAVEVPVMPEASEPRIYNWVPKLAEVVGVADEETYFVGHSMGCQTIVRYLETLPEGVKVGGAVFVAGFLKRLTGLDLEDDEVELIKDVANHWLSSSLDLQKVKSHLDKSVAIFSDNDVFVPAENQDEYKNILGSEVIIKHNMGHFRGDPDGVFELPIVLESLKKISQ